MDYDKWLLTSAGSGKSFKDLLMDCIPSRQYSCRNTIPNCTRHSRICLLLLSNFWVWLPPTVVLIPIQLTIHSIQSSERQGLILLLTIQIFVFASTFAHLIIAALPDALTAGAVATILFSLTMIFNG